jgi:hypothetical protein
VDCQHRQIATRPEPPVSKFNHALDVSQNVVVLAYAGVNMAGKQESATQTLQVDGVEYPIEQAPGVVTRCSWIGSRTLETIGKKDGVVLGRAPTPCRKTASR